MVKTVPCLFLAIGSLVACGSDNKATPDARVADAPPAVDAKVFLDAPPLVFDLACVPNQAPATASATVSVSGTVTEIGFDGTAPTITMLSGATVLACKGNCTNANQLATATTAAGGTFTDTNVATGGVPLAGYLKMTHSGDRTVQAYPATPITANVTAVSMVTLTSGVVGALGLLGFTQAPANGMLGVSVTDCADAPINDGPNLVLSIKQGGTAVTGTTTFDAGTLDPSYAGFYLIFNVPPGVTTVGATYKTTSLLAHDIESIAGTTSETIVRPGYR